MKSVTLFAQTPSTPEPIIAQVRRQLADDDRFGDRVPTGVLDRVADQAVRELWSSRVKIFVPVLALRTAREILRDQDLLIMAEHSAGRSSPPAAVRARQDGPPRSDILAIPGDVLPYDDEDVLQF